MIPHFIYVDIQNHYDQSVETDLASDLAITVQIREKMFNYPQDEAISV